VLNLQAPNLVIDGYSIPVKDCTLISGLMGIDVLEGIKIEEKELNPDVFHPPAGYRRVTLQHPEESNR
jgi:hypothetical protein